MMSMSSMLGSMVACGQMVTLATPSRQKYEVPPMDWKHASDKDARIELRGDTTDHGASPAPPNMFYATMIPIMFWYRRSCRIQIIHGRTQV